MIQRFLKLSNRIWTLKKKKKIHFLCVSHLERQRKEREKRTFARKGKEDLDFEKQKEKANDMMIHFPLFKQ